MSQQKIFNELNTEVDETYQTTETPTDYFSTVCPQLQVQAIQRQTADGGEGTGGTSARGSHLSQPQTGQPDSLPVGHCLPKDTGLLSRQVSLTDPARSSEALSLSQCI